VILIHQYLSEAAALFDFDLLGFRQVVLAQPAGFAEYLR